MTLTTQIRCMVIDDHPVVRAGLTAIISAQTDMEVVAETGNGQTAIELFRRHRPDVTLIDLRLPILGGVEAITEIRREFPAGRFIVLTTYEGDEDINRALDAGAQSYMLKGMTSEELVEAVRHVARGLRHIPQAVQMLREEGAPRLQLTPRESEVLELVVKGMSNREIADALSVTEGTVKSFINSILGKLGVRDRTQAATLALQRGLVHL
jgi:DNA-binding NarL/FixJ family response regulator